MNDRRRGRPTKADLEETIEELYREIRALNEEALTLRRENARLLSSIERARARYEELTSYVERLRDWASRNAPRKG